MSSELWFYHPRDPKRGPIPSTMNPRALAIIVSAIEAAWAQIDTFSYFKSDPFIPSHYDDEDQLSTKLAEVLNDMLTEGRGGNFRKEVFQTVVRDGKQSDVAAVKTELMPDLTFRTTGAAPGEDRDESALFVEAKLVDVQSGCRQYVVEGLSRFVLGRYAPRISFGLMLAYASGPPAPAARLEAYFANATSVEAMNCKATLEKSMIHPSCHVSEHTRNPPCAPHFQAFHLWVPRP